MLYSRWLLYVVHWPDKGVLNEYIIDFKDYVSKLLLKESRRLSRFDKYKPYST